MTKFSAEAARIGAVLRAALSRATIKAYALRLTTYTAWASATGRPWNHALTLLAFLSGPASQHSHAWRQQQLAALRYACREAGTADFTRDPAIAQAMRGLRRERPQKPAQVTGLTCEVIAKIEATPCAPRKGRGHSMESAKAATRRGHVAIALVRTMRDGLLRRSEAAALKWQDLSTESDGSARLHIARSKTDQEARGHVAYLTPARHLPAAHQACGRAARGQDLCHVRAHHRQPHQGGRHGRTLRQPLRARRLRAGPCS